MRDLDQFYATSGLKGQDWLNELAMLAFQHNKMLEYDDHNPHICPQVIVRDMETQKWLACGTDNSDVLDVVEDTIVNFDSIILSMEPLPGDEDNPEFESLPKRIVDILMEDGADEFVSSFSQEQEKEGGSPLGIIPSDKQDSIRRAIRLYTGHTLIMWDTYRAGDYGRRYVGYRLLTPTGRILFQGEDYSHGGNRDPFGEDSVRELLGFLTMKPGDTDDDYFKNYSPEQMEFAKSSDADQISMDAGNDPDEDAQEGAPPAFTDLPGYEYGW